jgi:hypothetical protein
MISRRIFPFFILLLIGADGFSQQWNYTLSRDFLWGIEAHYNNKEENVQTFVKPYRLQELEKISDSTAFFPRLLAGTKAEQRDKEARSRGQLEAYPLIATEGGYEMSSSPFMTNHLAIGADLLGFWKDKAAFSIKGLGGKGVYNSYTDSVIRQTHMVPGLGYAHVSKADSLHPQYAYEYFSGYLSWSPNKIFNFQAGKDKHFWGDGYRSLFLSDASAPYPFLKITTNVWKISYVNLFTAMKDATSSPYKKQWLNKYASFHHLGWNATKRINIGLFESIVWQGTDSTRHRDYDVNYLNPVIFFRPVEYSQGSSDNAFVGFDFKIRIAKKQQVYAQLLLDEFLLKEVKRDIRHAMGGDDTTWGWWANKQGYQFGFKSFDLFKVRYLNFQSEFNVVRPYTYSHGSVQQNYGHMNEPLAHPLGANFAEMSFFLNYRWKRVFMEAKFTDALYGADSGGTDYGKNIFISYTQRPGEYGNYTGQGFQVKLMTFSLRAAYMLDTRMNLKIELGFADRIEQHTYYDKQTPYFFFGIRSDLFNRRDDY